MKRSNDAVFLLDKPERVTSFGCISPIKKLFESHTGHAGTLDMFASGLLIVMTGHYTKLVPLFMDMDKTYEATIELGRTTDTLDPTGNYTDVGRIPTYHEVVEAVGRMRGEILQTPPEYSAVHVNGQRCYKLARKGEKIDIPAKVVHIHEAQIIEYRAPMLRIRLNVSKGTYIRSYARDLGLRLGTFGYVKELRRTKIGPYYVEEALDGRDAKGFVDSLNSIESHLRFLMRIPGMELHHVEQNEKKRLHDGLLPKSVERRIEGSKARYMLFATNEDGKDIPASIYDIKNRSFVCRIEYDGKTNVL